MVSNFNELDDLGFAEWSFTALVDSLRRIKPAPDAGPDEKRRLHDSIRMLEAGADVLFRIFAKFEDVEERIEALGCVELLIDSATRIALARPSPTAKAADATDKSRIRKRLIRALEKLYPTDPVVMDGLSRDELRAEVAKAADLPISRIDLKTLDRARKDAWRK